MNYRRRLQNLKIFARWLQVAPFIRAVVLNGSMTTGETRATSDIDLLIITAPRRLYLCRFFLTLLTAVTGLRRWPTSKNPAGRFCLNYYLSLDNLDIRPHTARCARFYRQMVRVWDRGGAYERLWRTNQWLRKFPSSNQEARLAEELKSHFPINHSALFSICRLFLESLLSTRLGDWLEQRLKNWQIRKITRSELYKKNKGKIIVKDNELRLHPKKIN